MPDGVDPLSLQGWLLRGAIREDDIPGSPFLTDDPVNAVRVLNHFYDPVYQRPLTVIGALGETAPNWATGSTDVFNQPNTPNTGRQNHYTVFDAREAMYRALTGRDVSGNPIAVTETERNKYWATTFRALGDVVHLVQDMAQPQHTRNDPHSGIPGGGHKSVYELYIEGMATQDGFRTPSGGIVPLKSIVYGDYPVPQFSSFSAYFSTWPKDSGILDRKGLADYSNRSFFSAGKNADSTEYPYPLGFGLTVQALDVDWLGGTVPLGKATVLLADLPDSLGNPTALKVPLATESLWDQFLETNTGTKTYTLTKKNYDAMADLLIPRAVAYSAGIINYFFRGKLDFAADTNNAGAYVIKNLGPEAMSGDFTLYYDAVDGKRYPVPGDQPSKTWAGRTIAKNSELANLSFTVPTAPEPEVSGKYMLVFNGDMGEEKAISGSTVGAVAAKWIEPERNGFLIQPSITPADGIAGPRLVYWDGSQWKLSREKGLQAGNVDWKGWYVNGLPTKVLSWMGSPTRYSSGENIGGASSPSIFQNGHLHAVAPCTVLGAALRKDASGKAQIVAACTDNTAYTRPDERSSSPALYDAVKNPKGWKAIIMSGAHVGEFAYGTPWFFNGDGTEAQRLFAVGATGLGSGVQKARLKLVLNEQNATITDLGGLSGGTYTYGQSASCGSPLVSGYQKHTGEGNLVAVDYLDKREIVATLKNNANRAWNERMQGTLCGNDFSYTFNRAWTGGEVLETSLETIALDVSTDTISQLDTHSANVVIDDGAGNCWASPEYHGQVADAENAKYETNQLEYIDLRTRTYLAMNNVLTASRMASGTCESHFSPEANAQVCEVSGIKTDGETRGTKFMHQGAQQAVIDAYSYSDSPPYVRGVVLTGGSGSGECGPSNPDYPANYAYEYFIGYPALEFVWRLGGVAVSAAGGAVVSWSINGKVLNHISGGALDMIFPGGGTGSIYKILGVVK